MNVKELISSLEKEIKRGRSTVEQGEALLRLQEIAKTYAGDDRVIPSEELFEEVKNAPKKRKFNSGFTTLDGLMEGFETGETIFLTGITKHGKCQKIGTINLMFDGSLKKVEDIRVGDLLMGPDSKLRRVLALGRGREEMYEIKQGNDVYTVNGSHILSLKRTRTNKLKRGYSAVDRKGEIVNISVVDYLKKSKGFKHIHKGWRTSVEWPTLSVPVDPYFLGLWLGDGDIRGIPITNMEKEIEVYLQGYSDANGFQLKKFPNGKTRAFRYSVIRGDSNREALVTTMRRLGVIGNKHIPNLYKVNSREVRLKLLAGLIDTDGYLTKNKWPWYELIFKSNKLAEDTVFLARSLGFSVTNAKCKKTIKTTGFSGEYNRIRISGDLSQIPVLVGRKKSNYKCSRDVLTQAISVKPVGEGGYCGFELDGDGLYLMGNFIVTHNTSFCMELSVRFEPENPLWLSFEEKSINLLRKFFERTGVFPKFFTPRQNEQPNLEWVEKKIVEAKAKYDSRIVFIDHIGFVKDAERGRDDTEASCLERISRAVHSLAVKWDVLIFLMGHLTKVSIDKNPDIENIKGSSAMSQEADLTMLVWRKTERINGKVVIGNETNLSLQANRRGQTGNVEFVYSQGRFLEHAWEHDENSTDKWDSL